MKRSAVVLASLSLLALTCKKEPPPAVQVPALELVAEDASCTEAWLRIRSLQVPATVQLIQVAPTLQTKQTLRLTSSDSLVIDEGLLPRRTYTYKAQLLEPQTPNLIASTPDVHVTTMDTTNHNFTWQIDTLGDGGGSVLYDVAIINDTLAYAVGEIYKRDSVGNWDPNAYNLAKWDGRSWELKRLLTRSECNPVDYSPLKAIWAFSDSDILVTSGGSLGWYNGRTNAPDCSIRPLVTGSINKIWASSRSDIYVVGNNGFIAHYDGVRWRRIESGTSTRLLDIWGTPGGEEVWACGWHASTGENVVLRKQSPQWQVMPLPPSIAQSELLGSLWIHDRSEVLITGSGDVFRQSILDLNLIRRDPVSLGAYAYRIRGTQRNDVALVGDASMVWTWNGFTWRRHGQLSNIDDRLYGLAISPTLMVAVGTRLGGAVDRNALVWIGRR